MSKTKIFLVLTILYVSRFIYRFHTDSLLYSNQHDLPNKVYGISNFNLSIRPDLVSDSRNASVLYVSPRLQTR